MIAGSVDVSAGDASFFFGRDRRWRMTWIYDA
jgi:hypothetical protein